MTEKEELQAKWDEYEAYYNSNGLTDELMSAFVMLTEYALVKMRDTEIGLQISQSIKTKMEEYCLRNTNGTIWQLEEYSVVNKQQYSIINAYYSVLLAESYYKLESFIRYMEKNREPKKRFYHPRRKVMETVVADLEQLENDELDFYGLSMPSRVGKLVADDVPVLTTNGWKRHGDLVCGDYVYGLDGLPKMVEYIHPKQYANKRVVFSDHTFIDCHENHEWMLWDRATVKYRVVETKYVQENLTTIEDNRDRARWYLPLKEIIQGEEKELKVPPYVLGVWLGDGTNKKPYLTLCNTDTVILDNVKKYGYEIGFTTELVGCKGYSILELREQLQQYGMCYSRETTEKHIPDVYLTASVEQRLELLAGLLDTDGTLVRKEHRYQYSTISKRLCDDIIALISTFGWRVSVSVDPCRASSSGIVGKHDVYKIAFNPTIHIPCKVERKQLFEFSKQRRLSVDKILDLDVPKQGNCITVEDGMYRVGERLIPTHNSTICIFFLCWVAMKKPNSHSAMGGHSGLLAKGFYKELMNFIETPEYTFSEIYLYWHPHSKILREKSAEDLTITLDEPDRFATITCRGIDGTWTGAVDISGGNVKQCGYLYVDDLVRDREHSLSPQRMETTYQEYQNKMLDRRNDGAKTLMVGTLWNVLDPLERERKLDPDNPRRRFRRIPALNDNDESNFDYEINGFSTKYYRETRDRLDKAEWEAKFQQRPFVREGLLMPTDELRYFNGILPEGDYRVVAVVDVAWGGGDSLSMPIGAEYDNGEVYVFDWVFNKGVKEITLPLVTGRIMANGIRQLRFEGDTGGNMYCQYVDEKLTEMKYKCSCTNKKAPNNMEKMSKIIAYSGDIKRKFIFIDPKMVATSERLEEDAKNGIKRYYRHKEYQDAMDEMTTFVTIGKNEHDDAIDGLTQLAMFIENPSDTASVSATVNPYRARY